MDVMCCMCSYFRGMFLLCVQVEACWAWPQLNQAQMASGHSPRFPAILVVFFCFLNLDHPLDEKKTNKPAAAALLIKAILNVFSLLSPQILWLTWPSLLLMTACWWPALQMRRSALWCLSLICSFFPLCGTSTLLLVSVAPGREPLGLCYSKSPSCQHAGVGAGRNLLSAGLCFRLRDLSKYTELPQTRMY